jgi:2-oxoglutarate/2-oxoacid ferredoxin oxidoreductase subunit alpha
LANIKFMQGNEACAVGAMLAGCRFFAGYPITPSTEIAEFMANELPKIGGKFIQMEDEIASMGAIIGASLTGTKAMTATSGPGFSLMQENIGYAYMTESPCVIVNVMRGGPSTGLPTKISQSDLMQARWGTHGDYTAIVYAPGTVQESLEVTIQAFNMSEKFQTPVVILLDEVIGHMRHRAEIPTSNEYKIINRIKPNVPAEWYVPYQNTKSGISPRANFGEGFRFHVTGLTHDQSGFPTANTEEIKAKLDKLRYKIIRKKDEITRYETVNTENCRLLIVAFGSAALSAHEAMNEEQAKHHLVGLFRPISMWPFPYDALKTILEDVRDILVVEHNMGQLVRVINEVTDRRHNIHTLQRYDGEPINPEQVLNAIKRIRRNESQQHLDLA